eukprot:9475056-Pyramimonas_sp.AAC.1
MNYVIDVAEHLSWVSECEKGDPKWGNLDHCDLPTLRKDRARRVPSLTKRVVTDAMQDSHSCRKRHQLLEGLHLANKRMRASNPDVSSMGTMLSLKPESSKNFGVEN